MYRFKKKLNHNKQVKGMTREEITIGEIAKYSIPPIVVPFVQKLKFAWLYTERVLDRVVKVTFAADSSCDAKFQQVLFILSALLPQQTKCRPDPILITIFLSDHRKILPLKGTVLDRENVNTGYASRCHEIVIYRKEEWRKVFIHECFHYFNFDMGVQHESIQNLFPVRVHVDLKETFCEVWARIINCALSGSDVEELIEKERKWACFQMVKILDFMDLTYDDLLHSHQKLDQYEENTNVFAYIVLSAILLQDARKFMLWSGGFNAPSGLAALIQEMHKRPEFIKSVKSAQLAYAREKRKGGDMFHTMRMSVVS